MNEIITSIHNPKIKQAVKLREARERKDKGLILIEGAQEISSALSSGVSLATLFRCPDLAGKNKSVFPLPDKNIVMEVSKEVFKKMAYRENPDGFLAIAKMPQIDLAGIKLSDIPLIIVLESVEKPGNLGAILRSADAAGADAVVVCDPKTDIYNPNVIRASLGTVFSKQVAAASTAEVIAWLKDQGVKIFAALPLGSKVYTQADYAGPSAIVVGTEHEGLSEVWKKEADEKIKIDMKGKIDSLNASVSLAIVLFEALRQREK